MVEKAVRFDQRQSLADPIVVSHDHRNLRRQPDRFANVGLVVIRLFFGIKEGKRGDDRSEDVHGQRVPGACRSKLMMPASSLLSRHREIDNSCNSFCDGSLPNHNK